MKLQHAGALLLSATATLALKDASPLVFLSSSQTPDKDVFESRQIATAESVEQGVAQTLQSCSHDLYFVVSQPGLTTKDLQDAKNFPKLSERVLSTGNSGKGSVVEVPQVLGQVDNYKLFASISQACDLHELLATDNVPPPAHPVKEPTVVRIELGGKDSFAFNDEYLDTYIASLIRKTGANSYALVFTSDASEVSEHQMPYEMDEPSSPLHTDLKRDVYHHKRRLHVNENLIRQATNNTNGTLIPRASNNTNGTLIPRASKSSDNAQAGLPLFEKYQFLSPAIFMGLTVSLLLILLLWVGISAIAGLEVSYAAFAKEMGPQAQNKGKQA